MTYTMKVAGLERQLPLCKVSDELYIGAFIMFGDAELTVACAKALLDAVPADSYDYMLTAEAKSIPLITLRQQDLFLGADDCARIKGRRILIVDDVISTGESLHALEELVKTAGGTVTGRAAVLAEGDALSRKDITCLAPLPLFNADGTVKE